MPRALLALLALLLLTSPATAQPRRVAILDFANATKDPAVDWLGAAAAEDVTTRLHAVRTLQLVERAQLYRLLQEQKLNLGDLVDPSHAVRLGRLLGAEQIVLGGYAVFGGSVRFNARFVDVATGAILATSQVSGVVDPKNPDALWKVFEQLAQATIDSLNTRVAIVQGTAQPTTALPAQRIEPTPDERTRLAKPATRSLEAQEAFGRGLVAYRSHRWAEAAREFERATTLDARYAAAWLELGNALTSLGRWPDALRAYENARQGYTAAGDERARARTLNNLGEVNRRQGRYTEALEYYEQSLRLAETLGDDQGRALTLLDLGHVHSAQGRYAEALGRYEQSLRLAETLADESGQARALVSVGIVHARQGRHDEAQTYYERGLRLEEKLGDEPGQAVTLNNLATLRLRQGRPAEALEDYERSLRLKEKLGDEPGQARTLWGIGIVRERQGRGAEALGYYDRALTIAERLGMAEGGPWRRYRDDARARLSR
jgi:tetratricopeptide (TPR) repeat protein